MSKGEWLISYYESTPGSVSARRPLLTLPRPRKKKEVLRPSDETFDRVRWLRWVQAELAASTTEHDVWDDDRWDDWGLLPDELTFEQWRRRDRAAKL